MRIGVVALLVASVLLAGCASTVPPSLTQSEADALVFEQRELWWKSMFPDEPMPVVEVIAIATPRGQGEQASGERSEATQCLIEAGHEWIDVSDEGFIRFSGTDDQIYDYMRAQFVCSMAYPIDTSNPHRINMYSQAELAYLRGYFQDRLVPCLASLGYSVGAIPRDRFSEGPYLLWSPYWVVTPVPDNSAVWSAVDLRCPPPPIGDLQYRPVASDDR